MQKNFTTFIERRDHLYETIKKAHPGKKGTLLLLAGFETERYAFRQDSSFYYYTGLEEPAAVVTVDVIGTVLHVPNYGTARTQWASSVVDADPRKLDYWGIRELRHLGNPCKGYSLAATCVPAEYAYLLEELERKVQQGEVIFTIYPPDNSIDQTLILDRLFLEKPALKQAVVDISPFVAHMRRAKSQSELELMYEAIDCTMAAHEAAAAMIEPEMYEYFVQAGIEFVFKQSGGSPAFPSIVGSGKNSTVLHYTRNDWQMRKGDLVVVDIGAELNYYCADLTRTYPVSGTFTDRQRQVYNVVLDTQQYIASIARPGYWLVNKDQPQMSLQHLAREFLKDQGYEQYFMHGIGHFLGLDVHDVGDYKEPLKEGDVITIEPGIYIAQEKIGIRIEDNYWITANGAVCMSEELPRDSYEIEQMMLEELDEDMI